MGSRIYRSGQSDTSADSNGVDMKTFIKTPAEKYPIWFNYSVDLTSFESVVSYVLTCVNVETSVDSSATIIFSDALSSPDVEVVIQAGAEGDNHYINCKETTGKGNSYDREALIQIQTDVTDDFIKQPNSTFAFSVKYDRRLKNGDLLASAAATAIKESDGTSVYGSIVLAPSVFAGTKIAVPVTGGPNGETYRIGVKGTTDLGYVYEKTVRMILLEI